MAHVGILKRWLQQSLFPISLILFGFVAYLNSFSAPFIFDDDLWIVENPNIRHLWPLSKILTSSAQETAALRPIVSLSLGINYALGGLKVWGYHFFNTVVHLLAAAVMFGIVRRTLLSSRLRGRYESMASWLAFVISLLWVVHPLHTESVTYIIQRAESLTGLFYLLTLYCAIRGSYSSRSWAWAVGSIFFCSLGAGSKPVIATAPLIVFIYDRVFLSDSFREAFRRRKGLYIGLAGTWFLLFLLLRHTPAGPDPTVGFGLKGITPWQYARTQPGVILHYLKLSFWPHPLCLDYHWPVARRVGEILPPVLVLGGFLAGTVVALRRRPELGFLGLWFFLILVPTSSFIPIADIAFEHRMYLPLAAVISFVVLAGHRLLNRHKTVAISLLMSAIVGLTLMTIRRNGVYCSRTALWRSVINGRNPDAGRPYNNLAMALVMEGNFEEATPYFLEAIRREPTYEKAHNNIGLLLARQGQYEEAIRHFQTALRLAPNSAGVYNNIGFVLEKQGKIEEAIQQYRQALQIRPDFSKGHNNLGLALSKLGKYAEAVVQFKEAARIDPGYAEAYNNLGDTLVRQGDFNEAVICFRKAVQLDPGNARARQNLSNVLASLGKTESQRGVSPKNPSD